QHAVGVARRDLARAITTAAVDDDDLVHVPAAHARERRADRALLVERRHDHGQSHAPVYGRAARDVKPYWADFLRDTSLLARSAEALHPAVFAADEGRAAEPDVRHFGLERMTDAHVRLQVAALGHTDAALVRRLVDAFVADTRAAWERNRPLLQRLARALRLGVVSNSYGNMPALLAEAALAPFEVIIDSALVGLRKPDPAIYTLAARRLDLPPAAILHVGDSWERDVVPAVAAGMRAVWLAAPDAPAP